MTDDGSESGQSEVLDYALRGDAAGLAAALEQGADPDTADRWGVTALAHAAQRGDLETLKILLEKGATPDRPSSFGNTALMAAAARGRDAVVAALLKAGADPAAQNKWGLAADDWGRWPENADDVRALLRQERASKS